MAEHSAKHGYRSVIWPAVVGIAGAALALWLLPPTTSRLGPSTVELSGRIGTGRTVLQVTPFGTISARTHVAPIDFTAALKQVDIVDLGDKITTATGRLELRRQIESEIPGLLLRTALKETIAAGLVGGLLAAALFHRRPRSMLVASAVGVVTMASLLGLASQGFNQSRFEDARFTGSLARARQLVEILGEHSETLDEARSRYRTAAQRLSDLMALLATPDMDPANDSTAILHISDLHGNPLGLEIAGELAREFEVSAVIDTGDLASSSLDTGQISSFAGPLDQLMVQGIEDLEVPYLFVAGNHDSPRLIRAVTGASNARVLDEEMITIDGIDVLGWGDPTYSSTPIAESVKSEQRLASAGEVIETLQTSAPDVLAVHDSILASGAGGLVPLVVSGHFHRRIIEDIDGTVFVAVGSTGATGLKSLTVETELLYEAEVLYMSEGRLLAIDYLTLKGLGEDFTLERETFAQPGV